MNSECRLSDRLIITYCYWKWGSHIKRWWFRCTLGGRYISIIAKSLARHLHTSDSTLQPAAAVTMAHQEYLHEGLSLFESTHSVGRAFIYLLDMLIFLSAGSRGIRRCNVVLLGPLGVSAAVEVSGTFSSRRSITQICFFSGFFFFQTSAHSRGGGLLCSA